MEATRQREPAVFVPFTSGQIGGIIKQGNPLISVHARRQPRYPIKRVAARKHRDVSPRVQSERSISGIFARAHGSFGFTSGREYLNKSQTERKRRIPGCGSRNLRVTDYLRSRYPFSVREAERQPCMRINESRFERISNRIRNSTIKKYVTRPTHDRQW